VSTPGGSQAGVPSAYRWAAPGDVNAFFGLMLDNVGDLILLAALLVGGYGFPADFVLTRMVPGTALGVLVGDLIYTGMAFRLARRERRTDVTAMPLGLDTPSTFGMVFLILGPAFQHARAPSGLGLDDLSAARHAWFVGIAMLLASGLFKLLCALGSGAIRRFVPRAGLLGSLVAIALVIISFLPLLELAAAPVAGFTALLIVLATLTARWQLPGRAASAVAGLALAVVAVGVLQAQPGAPALGTSLAVGVILSLLVFALTLRVGQVPGALMAVLVGSALFYGLHAAGLGPGPGPRPERPWTFALPWPMPDWLGWIAAHAREAASYLPVALPLALATVVGGIDCAESAAAAGDDFPTGPIIAAEGLATLVGGAFGGVIQSTPYIGHPAYKAMGGRAAYTLATGLFVGALGVFGLFGWIFHVVPRAAVFPILVFVGIEITQQSFRATARRHAPALVFACVPALAYLAFLMVDRLLGAVGRAFPDGGPAFGRFDVETQAWLQTLATLSGGFIVTSLLWGAALAFLIDGRWRATAGVLALGGMLALFGVIHSPLPGSPVLPPWVAIEALRAEGRLPATGAQTPYGWAAAYGAMALAVVLLGWAGRAPTPESDAGPGPPDASAD
jgi:AGZA family xanthine/uracil permease-like MFS transporter